MRLLFIPFCFVLFFFLNLTAFTNNVFAAVVPSGFTHTRVASGLLAPTAMEFSPDGRIFIAEQDGDLRIVKNGVLLPTPFLRLQVDNIGERGLLGVTLDPNFASNRFVYVYYTTNTSPIHNRLSRFTANGDIALAGSEIPLLDLDDLSGATNHNGGAIHFGLDGKLYVAVGENAVTSNSQDETNLLGKMLRINANGTIPSDNPTSFTHTDGRTLTPTGINRAIWAIGFRNPFTFAIHPTDGRIFVNDVGGASWEEINDLQKGKNYGWPTCEGNCSNTRATNPLYAYNHSVGVAITGGAFYEASQFPASYRGKYFFTDYTKDWIKMLDPTNPSSAPNFATGAITPIDLKVGSDGALYYLSINTGENRGELYKISYGTTPPTPTLTPTPTATQNQLPTATIINPVVNSLYSGGETISYSGNGTDPEDGNLNAFAFSWTIIFHHDTHTHPYLGPIAGVKSGSFQIPKIGETSDNVWFRIHLTVTDSAGGKHTVTRDVLPRKANITLNTNPVGLEIVLDGQPKTAPHNFIGVVETTRTIGVTTPQFLNSTRYVFNSWSDSGEISHDIDTPAQTTTYTAEFTQVRPGDVDQDGDIDSLDFNEVVSNFNRQGTGMPADLTGDGIVNSLDLNEVVINYRR